jgi:hypothetical protein
VRCCYGLTLNCLLLVSVPLGVVTVTKPVVAPLGTVVVKYVSDLAVKVAAVPLKETAIVPVNPCPRTSTVFPTLPKVDTRLTNGPRPRSKL